MHSEELLRLIKSSSIQDKWKGLVMASSALRNWTEEEILAVLESVGTSFLVSLLESNERQLRDMGALESEKMDLLASSLSVLASSCTSRKVCLASFWSQLVPHLANIVLRETKQVRQGYISENVINCWIIVCSVCSVQEELLNWFLEKSPLVQCMIQLCENGTRVETTTLRSQEELWRQLVKAMSCMTLAVAKKKLEKDTKTRKLLFHILSMVIICFDRWKEEPSHSLDMIHQLYLLSPYFQSVFAKLPKKDKVWKIDEHLRNALVYCLSNRLNDDLLQQLFSIVVDELRLWKQYDFDIDESAAWISSVWKYMRFILLMCSVELGVHLRQVLRAPITSTEKENNREIHLGNIFQLIELSVELFQRRMVETDECPTTRNSGSLGSEEKEEVKALEALVECIQVVVDFLEAEPLKCSNKKEEEDSQPIRLVKYFTINLRLLCCFCSLQLPVLEERIATVLVHSWEAILFRLEILFACIDENTFHDLISWTSFAIVHLVAYSETAVSILEKEVFAGVWIRLVQLFSEQNSSVSANNRSPSISQCVLDIIDLLVCLSEFPCNRNCIKNHQETLRTIQGSWPLVEESLDSFLESIVGE